MLVNINLADLVPDPANPRTNADPAIIESFAANLKEVGQLTPLIVYPHPEDVTKYMIFDGWRRWLAAAKAQIECLQCLVLDERPSKSQLRIAQWSIDAHREALNPVERCNLLVGIMAETKWGNGDLAKHLSMSPGMVTKLLSLRKLDPAIQNLVATGALDLERAYLIQKETDQTHQVELVKESAHLSREQLRAKVNGKQQGPKAKRSIFRLPSGMSFTVAGQDSTLEEVIEGLLQLVKELKRGLRDNLDITTAQRVLADKAKATQ